jgi:sugar O-acyltransferase (sialic acid O-acetyltransferase NeuD family)
MAPVGPAAQAANPAAPVMARPLVIIGGGEHARVVADAARSRPDAWRVIGYTDQAPSPGTGEALGADFLGDDAAMGDRLAGMPPDERPWVVLGVGDLDLRRRLSGALGPGARWATVLHASAAVSPDARIGAGSVVMAGAVVNPGARIGEQVIVNTRAVVEHDVEVGDFAHVAPGAVLGGGVVIGHGAFVGLGALVRDHVTVGDSALVGMGSVVVKDVASGAVVMGSPARERLPDESR